MTAHNLAADELQSSPSLPINSEKLHSAGHSFREILLETNPYLYLLAYQKNEFPALLTALSKCTSLYNMSEKEELNASKTIGSDNLPNPNQTSDLMGRLQAFLPKLQAANQALSQEQNIPKVDLDLQSESDSDDDNDADDSDEEEGENHDQGVKLNSTFSNERMETETSNAEAAPTIEIKFAMGNMMGNPLMELLANEDDAASENDDKNSSDVEGNLDERKRAITKILESDDTKDSHKRSATKKALITELS